MPVVVEVNDPKREHDLRFCFCNMENESRPRKSFEMHDHVSFDLLIVNLSQEDVKNLDLNIEPGGSTSFEPFSQRIALLKSNSKIIAKRITGNIISDPNDLEFYNHMAKITLHFEDEQFAA